MVILYGLLTFTFQDDDEDEEDDDEDEDEYDEDEDPDYDPSKDPMVSYHHPISCLSNQLLSSRLRASWCL